MVDRPPWHRPHAAARHRRPLPLVVILVTAVLAASCGGGGSRGKASPTTSASTATGPGATGTGATAPATTDPVLTARAAAAVLQDADFAAGWRTQPAGEGLHLPETWQDLMRCLGVDDKPVATATSGTYARGQATQVRTTVEYTTTAAAGAIAAALSGPKFQGCATDAFTADSTRSAPQGATPGPVKVAGLTVPPAGQKMSATRVNVSMVFPDLKIDIFQDFLVVVNGATVIQLFFLNPGSAFPPDLEQSLVAKVVGRT